jgi:hypothetical protein
MIPKVARVIDPLVCRAIVEWSRLRSSRNASSEQRPGLTESSERNVRDTTPVVGNDETRLGLDAPRELRMSAHSTLTEAGMAPDSPGADEFSVDDHQRPG